MNKQPPENTPEARHNSAGSAPPIEGTGRKVCYVCFKAAPFCICDGIVPVDNRTRIVIVQHKCERAHPIGTARIASLALANVELRIVWPDKHSKFTFELDEMNNPGLIFPGPGATDLAAVPAENRPGELLLLDGTWGDVRKLYKDNPWLQQLPQYSLNPTVPSRYRIRKEPDDQSISTIEAIVQSLGIIEPDTPGLGSLIDVFEGMIDRQIAYIRTQPAIRPGLPDSRRRRDRSSRSMPSELKGSIQDLVIAHGESIPWKGKKRTLVRWSAFRTGDEAVFDQFITPREGSTLTDHHLRHMGLCRQDMEDAVLPGEFRCLWNNFLRGGDILVTWNKGVLDWLDQMIENCRRSFFLKEAYCNTLKRKCGHLKDVVRSHNLLLPTMPIKGQAATKLSETVAMARYLNQLPETSPDSEAAEDSPDRCRR